MRRGLELPCPPPAPPSPHLRFRPPEALGSASFRAFRGCSAQVQLINSGHWQLDSTSWKLGIEDGVGPRALLATSPPLGLSLHSYNGRPFTAHHRKSQGSRASVPGRGTKTQYLCLIMNQCHSACEFVSGSVWVSVTAGDGPPLASIVRAVDTNAFGKFKTASDMRRLSGR